ncbi:Protein of unknown function [Bacillus wiedmannii]|uniref:Uncharacterized protein n=1 Tax=Bacillus wiedmannii TaxID=1890302 RepID=A0AB37Z0T4_9BACI|nr:Protein of unknown function [Bacillus wiedmannii]
MITDTYMMAGNMAYSESQI